MFSAKKICENCKTGMEAYLLEPELESCPHIMSWNDNTCPFYVPIKEEEEKKGLFEFLKVTRKNCK